MTFRRITIVLGSTVLIALGWKLGWTRLLAGVLRLGPTGWLAVIGLQLIAFAADALALKACAGPWSPQLRFTSSLRACMVAQAVNTVTPFGQLGEAHKLRRLPAEWPTAIRAGTVLLHNHVMFLGTCASVAVGLVVGALALEPRHARAGRAAFAAAAACVAVAIAVHALVMRGPGPRVRGLIDRLGARWPALGRLSRAVDEATVAAGLLSRSRSTLLAVAATMVKRALLVAEALIVLRNLGCPSPTAFALLSSGGSQLVTWTTSFIPAQVGAAEARLDAAVPDVGRLRGDRPVPGDCPARPADGHGRDRPDPRLSQARARRTPHGTNQVASGDGWVYIRRAGPFRGGPTRRRTVVMCRSIKILFNFEPPATDEEIRAASLQFVRKLSGFTAPSKTNEAAFDAAVKDVFQVAHRLVHSLVTTAPARNREVEAEKAKARSRERFGRGADPVSG